MAELARGFGNGFDNGDIDFLDFDADDFTEDALRRITQMVEDRQEGIRIPIEQEPLNIHECKLYMNITGVEGIPKQRHCFGLARGQYKCEVEVMKMKSTFNLYGESHSCGSGSGIPAQWDLAEYFGQTKIKISLKEKKLFKDVVVGTRILLLSDLLARQKEGTQQRKEQQAAEEDWTENSTDNKNTNKINNSIIHSNSTNKTKMRNGTAINNLRTAVPTPTWSISYLLPMSTSLRPARDKTGGRGAAGRNPNRTLTPAGWLASAAKSATSSLSSTPGVYNNNNSNNNNSNSCNDTAVNSQLQAHKKTVEVVVRIEFRLVQLQDCTLRCIDINNSEVHIINGNSKSTTSGEGRVDKVDKAVPSSKTAKSTGSASELHFLLASGFPATFVVDILRALSRKSALTRTLDLRVS